MLLEFLYAAVAQSVRAPDCGSGGPQFESRRLYHPKNIDRNPKKRLEKISVLANNLKSKGIAAIYTALNGNV